MRDLVLAVEATKSPDQIPFYSLGNKQQVQVFQGLNYPFNNQQFHLIILLRMGLRILIT